MPRTFIAVEIAAQVRQQVVALAERLRPAAEGIRWVDPKTMHLTLNFLGDTDDNRIDAVCQTVAQTVASFQPFGVELGGVGAFPDARRARNVWVGLTHGSAQLGAVQAALAVALAKLGFPREWRPFTPHLTLGRLKHGAKPPRALGEQMAREAGFIAGKSAVSEVVVFASELAPGGPTYHVLGRGKLSPTVDAGP